MQTVFYSIPELNSEIPELHSGYLSEMVAKTIDFPLSLMQGLYLKKLEQYNFI